MPVAERRVGRRTQRSSPALVRLRGSAVRVVVADAQTGGPRPARAHLVFAAGRRPLRLGRARAGDARASIRARDDAADAGRRRRAGRRRSRRRPACRVELKWPNDLLVAPPQARRHPRREPRRHGCPRLRHQRAIRYRYEQVAAKVATAIGELGSFTWADGGSDSPWLPGAPIVVCRRAAHGRLLTTASRSPLVGEAGPGRDHGRRRRHRAGRRPVAGDVRGARPRFVVGPGRRHVRRRPRGGGLLLAGQRAVMSHIDMAFGAQAELGSEVASGTLGADHDPSFPAPPALHDLAGRRYVGGARRE